MNHNTIKKLAGLTAAAAMALTSTALADTTDSGLVKGGALNLRQEPSIAAKVLGQFPTGTLVEIIESGSEWHKVEVDGQAGYMMSRFITTAEESRTATVRTNTGIGLNLRSEPDMKGSIVTSVRNGSTVTVTQKGSNWCRVEVNGQEGFMATRYLSFTASTQQTGSIAIVNNPRDTQVLNLRQGPSTDTKVVDYYRNGTRVTILKAGKTWHKVQVEDGKVGYMMSKYLRATNESGSMKPVQATLINVNGGSYVNFRKGASLSASVIARLPVGSSITVIEHGADWCRVNVDGVEGYVSTWFLKF